MSGEGAQAGPRAEGAISDRRLAQTIITALVLGFLALAATAGTAVWLVGRAQEYADWVDHSYEVESRLSGLQIAFERTEAARRGYLLTRDDGYVEIYRNAGAALPQNLAALRTLTLDNPAQQQRLAQLTTLFDQETALLARSVATTREGEMAAAIRLFRQESNAQVQRIRTITNDMAVEENRLRIIRSDRQTANTKLLLAVVLAAAGLLGVLAALSFVVMRRYAKELRASEARLRTLNEGLETAVAVRTADLTRANEEIQRFAYIVSHDLRAPLVNVMGFTSELELAAKPLQQLIIDAERDAPSIVTRAAKAAVDLDLPESIGFIRSSTRKMDRLISAILKLSREGRRTLAPERISVPVVVGGIAESLRHQLDERGAELTIEGPIPDIVTDRLAFEQILSNLIENAVKYLQPGRPGRIVVRGRAAGDQVTFDVQDNGRGVDPKDHERIFELFRRAGVQDQAGEGIGLAHVRALIYRLGGTIDCVSSLDQGATFSISLPKVPVRDQEVSA